MSSSRATDDIGNPLQGRGSYRIKGDPKPLPEEIAETAGDAAHNIRTAFDHFACSAVSTPTRDTAFPVWRAPRIPSVNDWRGLVRGKLKGASRQLVQAVEDLEAYKTGKGEFVWCIDELDRTDKHIELIEVAGANTGLGIDGGKLLAAAFPDWEHGEFPATPLVLRPEWTPMRKGTDLFIVQDEKGFAVEPAFMFDAALAEPDVLRGAPVVLALRKLTDQAEELLMSQLAFLA